MRKALTSLATLLFVLIAAPISVRATDAYVGVGLFSLSPETVNIKAGDVVYWIDSDEDGPYMISGPWGSFLTPGGIRFLAPGAYSYSVDSIYGGYWYGAVNVSAAVDSPPTVSITSPANSSQFVAPASFTFSADASDPDLNDVWDVEFWVGTNMVDDVYSPPYTTTVTNLEAGTYTLSAIVWDYSYVTATNSIVITVVNPGPISLTAASVLTGGKFVFSANGVIAGKTNVLLCSSNLVDWLPIQTNVADSSSINFTNSASARRQFFRVMQLN
jgi:hypothetical protein